MPKTIAITPSWYWPQGIPRVVGVPPYSIFQLCLLRQARLRPQETALIDAAGLLSYAELLALVEAAAAGWAEAVGESKRAEVDGALSRQTLVQLLGALAAGMQVRFRPGAAGPAPATLQPGWLLDHNAALDPALPALAFEAPAGPAWHSNRTLLAMAISMATFLDAPQSRPWLSTLPLHRWEGMMAALIPLYLGATLIIAPPGADPDTVLGLVSKHHAGFAAAPLEEFATVCREAKRAAKDARRVLDAAILAVDGPFDPDQRRRVSKSLECPALTFWGTAETGPVFASHQSWYMDESVGLPMTNAHVVPCDPRTGEPIQALWELVEMAEVSVFSPSLAKARGEEPAPLEVTGSRYRTGMMASSDANGMVYLLGS